MTLVKQSRTLSAGSLSLSQTSFLSDVFVTLKKGGARGQDAACLVLCVVGYYLVVYIYIHTYVYKLEKDQNLTYKTAVELEIFRSHFT